VTHRFAHVNGVRLHYVEAQPATTNGSESTSGRWCLLLHGFPEFWYSWRHQLPALARAGFRAVAPDLRGYNLSDKPPGIRSYRLDHLLGDLVGLIHHLGEPKASVVGHDWGGVLAWHLAIYHPDLVERLVILNAPHPAAYQRELHSWRQLLKSWYVFLFQVPGLAEQLISAGDFDLVERMFRHQPVNPNAFTPEDVRLYKHALARPGALTAALKYYRANSSALVQRLHNSPTITVPTLLLWGERDNYLSPRLTEGLQSWVTNLSVVRFPDVSHWIQNDAPERVNWLMVEFLKGSPVTRIASPALAAPAAPRIDGHGAEHPVAAVPSAHPEHRQLDSATDCPREKPVGAWRNEFGPLRYSNCTNSQRGPRRRLL
jgi:pimeloyl-ACP methyl ester carboxylesterase